MSVRILLGDVRARLADLPPDSVHCVVTSPPYWGLRDYGVVGQLGLEPTLGEHIATMVDVFRAVRRVLRPDGVCFVNYGDCYATTPNGRSAADTKAAGGDDRTFRDKPFSTVGPVFSDSASGGYRGGDKNFNQSSGRVVAGGFLKPKDLCMVPQRFAIAMQDDGWWVRSVFPWLKRNAMPESVSDRPATATEWMFMFTKSSRYFWDADAVRRQAAPAAPYKAPSGWDQSEGAHGSIHREGGARSDKQRGHSRRHAGFNARWDAMDKAEQAANGRNFRNSDLFFDSLDGAHGLIVDGDGLPLAMDVAPKPFSEAHFATFPPDLVEPLIRGATSERGVCPHCGAPWVRVANKDLVDTPAVSHGSAVDCRDTGGLAAGDQGSRRARDGHVPGMITRVVTIGWEPSCSCEGNAPVPAVVLDPFGGAGTTALVADIMQRDAIITELNPEYAEIARKRIQRAASLFAQVDVEGDAA